MHFLLSVMFNPILVVVTISIVNCHSLQQICSVSKAIFEALVWVIFLSEHAMTIEDVARNGFGLLGQNGDSTLL